MHAYELKTSADFKLYKTWKLYKVHYAEVEEIEERHAFVS